MAAHKCKQEDRIRTLEQSEAVMANEIKNLIEKLSDLTGWIKALIFTVIPIIIAAFGFLLAYWVKK